MTKLSVNINKIATLRNSRGGDLPNVVKAAWAIFGDSYRYRALYNEYKAKRMESEKAAKKVKAVTENLPGQMVFEGMENI